MILPKVTAFALLSLVALSSATAVPVRNLHAHPSVRSAAALHRRQSDKEEAPPPAPPPPEPRCDVSEASPLNSDIDQAVRVLQERGGDLCSNKNAHGSMCTTLVTQGTAAIGICGGIDYGATSSLNCSDVSKLAVQLQDTCGNRVAGRSGGENVVRPSKSVILFNSVDAA